MSETIKRMEDAIADAAAVYSEFRRVVLRYFAGFLVSPEQSPREKERLQKELTALEVRYADEFTRVLTDVLGQVLGEALDLLEMDAEELGGAETETLEVFVDALIQRANESIRYQMRADVDSLIQTYGQFLMRVELVQRQRRITRANALVAERERALRALELYRRDALGRKRDSEQFVMVELHYVAYRLFNLTMVWALSLQGEDRALIHRPGHALDGVVFDLEDFENMENEVFHPNAQAVVFPVKRA